jgi:hypothetical protein
VKKIHNSLPKENDNSSQNNTSGNNKEPDSMGVVKHIKEDAPDDKAEY